MKERFTVSRIRRSGLSLPENRVNPHRSETSLCRSAKTGVIGRQKTGVIATSENGNERDFEEKTRGWIPSQITMVIRVQKTGVIGRPRTGVIENTQSSDGGEDLQKNNRDNMAGENWGNMAGANPGSKLKTGAVKTGIIWPG